MRSVPGIYSVGHRISRQRRLGLTSVKAAKELGIKVHVSMENIAKTPNASRGGKIHRKRTLHVSMASERAIAATGSGSVHAANQGEYAKRRLLRHGVHSLSFPHAEQGA